MSVHEVVTWQKYIEENGTLDVGRKVDAAAALLAFMSGKTAKPDAKIEDFLPRKKKKPTSILDWFGELKNGDN